MGGSTVRRRVVVHGRVQGVFFRDSCRKQAENLGVAGWVRNQPDGTVTAAFEGDPGPVQQMIDWAHTGPSAADVREVTVTAEGVTGERGFRVE